MTSAEGPAPSRGGPSEMFVRHPANPIITAADLPRMVNAVFNPGATVFDGQTLLLLRVEDRTGLSHLVVARSPDGYRHWIVELDRGMFAQTSTVEEAWGIEDPRITRAGDEYHIVYTGYSTTGPLVLLASTRDFVHFDRRGVLAPPDHKDAALFPARPSDVVATGLVSISHAPMLAYEVALLKGTDVDQPRNLAKSVTVE